jgi:hypothetical protein
MPGHGQHHLLGVKRFYRELSILEETAADTATYGNLVHHWPLGDTDPNTWTRYTFAGEPSAGDIPDRLGNSNASRDYWQDGWTIGGGDTIGKPTRVAAGLSEYAIRMTATPSNRFGGDLLNLGTSTVLGSYDPWTAIVIGYYAIEGTTTTTITSAVSPISTISQPWTYIEAPNNTIRFYQDAAHSSGYDRPIITHGSYVAAATEALSVPFGPSSDNWNYMYIPDNDTFYIDQAPGEHSGLSFGMNGSDPGRQTITEYQDVLVWDKQWTHAQVEAICRKVF